jgi:ATP-dependent RNA helicase RhlE
MDKQTEINIESEMSFSGLGIAPKLLDVILGLGFKTPTSIQHKAIAPAIEGKDIIGIAQTGTGKTLAFGIPLVQKILKDGNGKGLIILPTRELAIQVEETIKKIGRAFGIKTAVLIGGASMYQQVHDIRNNPHVVIGTPGRIIDHIQQRTLSMHDITVLVLDEADRMFDMGFAPQIKKILDVVPKNRQTMLFSATMPDGIVKIATSHMKLPVRVEIARPGTTADNIEHELFVVKREQRLPLLKKLLGDYKGSVLIFVRVKHGARKICDNLRAIGVSAAEIHSNRSLNQRKEALEGFKLGRYRVLVATDIAQRGIDVKNIELVINFDLPEVADDYVHRIGRTGRAGMSGKAISFAMPDQGGMVREIERLTRVYLPISKLPDLSSFTSKQVGASESYKENYPPRRNNRPSGRSGYAKRRY